MSVACKHQRRPARRCEWMAVSYVRSPECHTIWYLMPPKKRFMEELNGTDQAQCISPKECHRTDFWYSRKGGTVAVPVCQPAGRLGTHPAGLGAGASGSLRCGTHAAAGGRQTSENAARGRALVRRTAASAKVAWEFATC